MQVLFHLKEKDFKKFIEDISIKSHIDVDVIEKDYYVCLVLNELSKKQDEIKAYFKGGTAVYKILDTMNRFSEDIDLTVKVLPEESNTKNKKRLKESALGYKIQGLELIKDECIDNKGSITGVYKYQSVYEDSEIPLQRAGKIQVESTSFTVSEPTEKYYIEPLIYKLANNKEKKILEEQFDITKIEITNENYRYLQFIDILDNKDNINIEVENADEILYRIIEECKLDFEKIIKYARETNNRKVLDKLFVLAR